MHTFRKNPLMIISPNSWAVVGEWHSRGFVYSFRGVQSHWLTHREHQSKEIHFTSVLLLINCNWWLIAYEAFSFFPDPFCPDDLVISCQGLEQGTFSQVLLWHLEMFLICNMKWIALWWVYLERRGRHFLEQLLVTDNQLCTWLRVLPSRQGLV